MTPAKRRQIRTRLNHMRQEAHIFAIQSRLAAQFAQALAQTGERRIEHAVQSGELAALLAEARDEPGRAVKKLALRLHKELGIAPELLRASAEAWESERLRCEGEARALRRALDEDGQEPRRDSP